MRIHPSSDEVGLWCSGMVARDQMQRSLFIYNIFEVLNIIIT